MFHILQKGRIELVNLKHYIIIVTLIFLEQLYYKDGQDAMFLQFQQNKLQEIVIKKLLRILKHSYNISQNKQLNYDIYIFLINVKPYQEHRILIWRKLPKQSVFDVYEKFKKNFPHSNGKEVNSDLLLKVFQLFLLFKQKYQIIRKSQRISESISCIQKPIYRLIQQFNSFLFQDIMIQFIQFLKELKNLHYLNMNNKTENLIFTNQNDVNVTAREIVLLIYYFKKIKILKQLIQIIKLICQELNVEKWKHFKKP
ncbi:unnamed protein product [Paramecium sonneborni]|uniref:Uncharacterized protein n=1 Tax=Paramecium sonneborni TaxID=65129 RepID=A0A8S1QL64_9CILI|nr:unnamed protein product [Paramecium sonneborni]